MVEQRFAAGANSKVMRELCNALHQVDPTKIHHEHHGQATYISFPFNDVEMAKAFHPEHPFRRWYDAHFPGAFGEYLRTEMSEMGIGGENLASEERDTILTHRRALLGEAVAGLDEVEHALLPKVTYRAGKLVLKIRPRGVRAWLEDRAMVTADAVRDSLLCTVSRELLYAEGEAVVFRQVLQRKDGQTAYYRLVVVDGAAAQQRLLQLEYAPPAPDHADREVLVFTAEGIGVSARDYHDYEQTLDALVARYNQPCPDAERFLPLPEAGLVSLKDEQGTRIAHSDGLKPLRREMAKALYAIGPYLAQFRDAVATHTPQSRT